MLNEINSKKNSVSTNIHQKEIKISYNMNIFKPIHKCFYKVSYNFLSFQYIELYKVKSESVSLENYGIIVCDVNGETYLNIRLAIDLSGAELGEDQHFGLITNADQFSSLIPKFPNRGNWRIFGGHNSENWLEISDGNLIAVFLVYTNGNKLFDIYQKNNRLNWFPLKDTNLAFLQVLEHLFIV